MANPAPYGRFDILSGGKVFLQTLEPATGDHRLVGGVALGRAHMAD